MITKEDAMQCGMFYHVRLRNSDGSALRCRANGKCKTWKRDPSNFRLPVKYGLRECFYLTPENAHEWLTEDPTEKKRPKEEARKVWEKKRKRIIKEYKLVQDLPDEILKDFMKEKGLMEHDSCQ